jgi:Ca2+-binding EF-hand superfamily protein
MKKILVVLFVLGMCLPLFGAQEKKGQDAEAVFKRLDKNNDKKLSKDEFVGDLDGEKKTKKMDRFTAMDKDKDGFVSLEELKAGLMGRKKNK